MSILTYKMKFEVTTIIIVLGFTCILQSACDSNLDEFVDWYPSLEYYKFYPRSGRCYEIYDKNENITPLICQRPFNPEQHSCIDLITHEGKHCLGLKTSTNETVLLLCENSQEKLLSYHLDEELNNCFNVSRPDESYEEVCQQKFGNYSIGVTTPDNFTVLFESYFCATSINDEERETYSKFMTTFSFSPETKSCYKIYDERQKISPYTCFNDDVFTSCVEELPHIKNCEGIITQNNETVVLQCTTGNVTIRAGSCFKIYTANNKQHISCLKQVEERCIGITTPSNLTILVECSFCSKPGVKYASYNVEEQRRYRKFIKTYLSNEYIGKNSYLGKLKFESYKRTNYLNTTEYFGKRFAVYGYWLPKSDCYGITLESNETVILDCISKDKDRLEKSGCFPLITPGIKQEQTVCSKILNETCVGITTPLNWSVALACYSDYENTTSHRQIQKKKYADSLEEFKLFPGLNNCYEIYHSNELSPYSCRKSANPKKYSCVQWIPGEKHCLGLKTPSNQTIEFVCGDSQEDVLTYKTFSSIENCFVIYGSSKQLNETICQKQLGNYSVGLTTPSNHSILLDSFFCPAYKTSEKIQEYKEFIGNFTFDHRIRSCYKIYTPEQDVSPYTCLRDDVYDACIHRLENSDCIGIKTQHNETVILACANDSSVVKDNGTDVVNKTKCFKIFTSDNRVETSCVKQIEERCMGIVTPSNLTVLFECHTCVSTKGGSDLPIYSDAFRKVFRSFVEFSLYTITQNNNALENKTTLSAYTPEQDIKFVDCYNEIDDYDIHVLHGHENCRGITLSTSETVVLDCFNKLPERSGCFDVFSPVFDEDNKIIGPNRKVDNVCVKILNEWCVGIVTPKNWTVPLSCLQVPDPTCPFSSNVQ